MQSLAYPEEVFSRPGGARSLHRMCRRCFGNGSYGESGFLVVDYSELPNLTLRAIRELKAEDDRLREEVEQFRQQ